MDVGRQGHDAEALGHVVLQEGDEAATALQPLTDLGHLPAPDHQPGAGRHPTPRSHQRLPVRTAVGRRLEEEHLDGPAGRFVEIEAGGDHLALVDDEQVALGQEPGQVAHVSVHDGAARVDGVQEPGRGRGSTGCWAILASGRT